MSKKHLTIKVYGKVHDVSFRSFTREEARNLGITGFVKNEPDGSVLVEAQGEKENLGKFSEWCKNGPKHARVEKIEVEEKELENFTDFEVRQ